MKELLNFKGVKEGIYVEVNSDDLNLVLKELDSKLKKNKSFYKGIKLLEVKSEEMSLENKNELKMYLKYKYDFDVDLEKIVKVEKVEEKNVIIEGTKFIKRTLRSGQVVSYEGNIVVIGDINPGALVEATGNIVVLGILRGVAHAGKGGNDKAIVAAYKLNPTQLRISEKIARSPDEDINSIILPEVASIRNGEVYIEPYLPNK